MDSLQCYVCHEEDTVENPFASDPKPCTCIGSIVLHKDCLIKLLQRSDKCSICKKKFNIIYKPLEDGFIIKHLYGYTIRYMVNDSDKFHGIYEIWENESLIEGKRYLMKRINYVNGVKNGLYESWWENGKLQKKTNYVNDKKEGLYEEWYYNGQLMIKVNYVDDKKEGLYEEWWENGNLKIKCHYTNDKKNGLYEEWNASGILKESVTFVNGRKQK